MVGCRYNAKNTLVKNYLYFAEKWDAQILAECEVVDVRPVVGDQAHGARYQVIYRKATGWSASKEKSVRARNVIFSAGSLGTLRLLFRLSGCDGITAKDFQPVGYQCAHQQRILAGIDRPEFRDRLLQGHRHHLSFLRGCGHHSGTGPLPGWLFADALSIRAVNRFRHGRLFRVLESTRSVVLASVRFLPHTYLAWLGAAQHHPAGDADCR